MKTSWIYKQTCIDGMQFLHIEVVEVKTTIKEQKRLILNSINFRIVTSFDENNHL